MWRSCGTLHAPQRHQALTAVAARRALRHRETKPTALLPCRSMLAIQLNVHTNFQPMRVALRSSRIRSSCRQPLLFNTRSSLLFAPAGRSPAATRTLASLQQAQQAIDSDAMDRDEKEQQPQLRKLEELRRVHSLHSARARRHEAAGGAQRGAA